jgi:predicted site-specific integrase-resolvase
MSKTGSNHLYRPVEAAELLLVSADTLARWRRNGTGPRFLKFGRGRTAVIRYRQQDIEDFVQDSLRCSTSDLGDVLTPN